jgi:hypothetical protein
MGWSLVNSWQILLEEINTEEVKSHDSSTNFYLNIFEEQIDYFYFKMILKTLFI